MTVETEVIKACVRQCLSGDGLPDQIRHALPTINWSVFLWLARSEHVLALVSEVLRNPDYASHLPPGILDQLRAFRSVSEIRYLNRMREVCRLQDAFERFSVSAVLVDEWFAAHCASIGGRLAPWTTAIRYLVPLEGMDRCLAALEAANHPVFSNSRGLYKVDRDPIILNRGLGCHSEAMHLWPTSQVIPLSGRPLRHLSPVHWLLQRVAEQPETAKTSLSRAWITIGLTASFAPSDWTHLVAEARRFDLEPATCRLIAYCHEVLGLRAPQALPRPLPESAIPRLQKLVSASTAKEVAPYLPTPPRTVDRMLELAEIGPGDTVYDLGCGDGRILVGAAQRYGARGVGVDLDPVRIAEAEKLADRCGVADRVRFVCGDLFAVDISDATVLCLYLLPDALRRVSDKIARELRPGARVLSNDYMLPDWLPDHSELVPISAIKISQIYLWRVR